jgi:hypothetical protein
MPEGSDDIANCALPMLVDDLDALFLVVGHLDRHLVLVEAFGAAKASGVGRRDGLADWLAPETE